MNENYFISAAELDSKIVGYVIAFFSLTPEVFVIRRRLYIQDMVIDPVYRRAAIAGELLKGVMGFASEHKVEKNGLAGSSKE